MPWASSLESAKRLAAQKNQLVMVHFWAPNCPPCRMLDATLFKDPAFAAAVTKDYVPVKINAAEQTEIANQYGVDRWPQDVIILPSGQMVYRMVSKQEKDKAQYLAVLHGVAIKTAGMSQLASTATPEAQPVSYPGEAAAPGGSYSRFGAAPAAPQSQSRFSMPPAASTYSQNDATAPAAAPSQPTQSRFSTGGYAAAPANESTPQPSGYSAGPAAGSQYAAASAPPQAQPSTPPPTQSRFATQPSGSSYGEPSQTNQPPMRPAPQAQPQDRFAAQPAAQPQSQHASQSTPPQSSYASQSRQPAAAPAAAAAPQAQPQQSQQPEFALDGFCPVTLAEGMRWQKGDARWGAVHQGRVYLFASDVQQRKFLASPDRFSPVLSGNDPVAYIEQGRLVDGNRSHGLTYNGVLYLFSSEDNLKTFWSAPQRYAAQVQQAMLRNSQQLR
ncbi:thioredoxin family protein [Blastopirellula retiformator]|nr:thioredoxin family protein [Blastopirellula retiformator]